MTDKEAAILLDPEWEQDTGYFGRLRAGRFSREAHRRVMDVLRSVETPADAWDARFVALVWFIPTFMTWQIERCVEHGTNVHEYNNAINDATDALSHVFGIP